LSRVESRSRPKVDRRTEYVPSAPQEEFMVPLLRRHIEDALDTYATDGGEALDVGCGRQPFRSAVELHGYDYVGLDVEPGPGVDHVGAIDEPLPPEIGSDRFSLVLCLEVLEHVADWKAAFANLAHVLAPGGTLLVTCPHFYQLHEEPYDFWRPTTHALELHGSAVGLEVVEIAAAGDAWDLLGTALATIDPVARDRRFGSRALARVIRRGRRTLLFLLQTRRLQDRVRLNGPLYISNVAIFREPASPP
jgi:SAM-dependent methyltransferase